MNHQVAICQPHYIPWIGYFEMIDRVDEYIFLDDVQFVQREWKNRNQIRKAPLLEVKKWLTVPIIKEDHRALICNARIDYSKEWMADHLNQILQVYKDAPFFDEYFSWLDQTFTTSKSETLGSFNIECIKRSCELLNINTKLTTSSQLNVSGKKEERLRNLCEKVNASSYLANNKTAEYVGPEYFSEKNMAFDVQKYSHPQYKQNLKKSQQPFLSHLSFLDLLFHQGPNSLKIIQEGRP
jgi:hypothetical protein